MTIKMELSVHQYTRLFLSCVKSGRKCDNCCSSRRQHSRCRNLKQPNSFENDDQSASVSIFFQHYRGCNSNKTNIIIYTLYTC